MTRILLLRAFGLKRKIRIAWIYWCVLLGAISTTGQPLATWRGQVLDLSSGFPIEGATISLDQVPPDANLEHEAESDLFGFFEMAGIGAGSYRLEVRRGGYLPYQEEVTMGAGANAARVIRLTPSGLAHLDLSFSVACVTSGVKLGGVPVQLERFVTAEASAPVEISRAITDFQGNAMFRGVSGGWYGFRVNDASFAAPRPRWDPILSGLASGQHAFLNQPHHANVRLVPQKQSLTVQVTGFDPQLSQNNSPLEKFVVEVTGVDPLDPAHAVMPVQTSMSDGAGQAVFTGLPAIAYRVVAKRIGYDPAEVVVQPDAAGALPPARLNPRLKPTHLFIELGHPYTHSNFVAGLRVEIEGKAGTPSEGIRRAQLTYDNRFPRQRAFFNLMPGNYRVKVNGVTFSGPPGNAVPHFIADEQVDAIEGVWTDLELPLTVEPGRVRGQLLVADQMGGELFSSGGLLVSQEAPVFKAGTQIPVEIVEYEGDSYLIASLRTNSVTTDDKGEFAVELPPGRYGVKIPEMSDHWGHSIRLRNLTTTVNSEKSVYRGWPYADRWPFAGSPPSNLTGEAGHPVLIRSGQDYQMELFVLKQVVSLIGEVDQVSGNGKDSVFTGMATLQPETGPVVSMPLTEPIQGTALYHFKDVPPGTYRVTFAAPHYETAYAGGGTSTRTVMIPRRPAPGMVPATDPIEDDSPRPFDRVDLGHVAATYIQPTTGIKVITYRYEPSLGGYGDGFEVTGHRIVTRPDGWNSYEGAVRNLPYGSFEYWVSTVANSANVPRFMIRGRIGEGTTNTHSIYWGSGPNDTPVAEYRQPGPPNLPAHWTIRVVNAQDTGIVLSNVNTTVTLDTSPTAVERTIRGEHIESGYEGELRFLSVRNANWVVDSVRTREVRRQTREYLTEIRLRRGTAIRGTVRASGIAGAPLAGVRVLGRTRFGGIQAEATTATDGTFNFAQELSSAPIYLDVDTPGYLPWRKRFTAADAVPIDADDSLLVAEIALEPLPTPTITGLTFDRAGLFLPGLNRVGDIARYSPSNAVAALTLTWTGSAEAAPPLPTELPAFDTPAGQPGAPLPPHDDYITEFWLIDPRSFTNRALQGSPAPLLLPAEPGSWLPWLRRIANGTISNVFYQRIGLPVAKTNTVGTTNSIHLWKLPEGEFNPIFLAVSQRGAVGVRTNPPSADEARRLRGVRMPPWLSYNTDVLASMSAFLDNPNRPLEIAPQGRFLPKNAFTASITNNATGFLDYAYRLDLDWREGMDNPGGELLDFLLGFIGVEFQTAMHFGLHGEAGEAYIQSERHDVFFDSEPLFEYIPLPVIPIARVSVDAAFQGSKKFVPVPEAFELEVTDELSARLEYGVTAQIDFDLEKYFSFIGGRAKRLGLGGAEATLRGATEIGSEKTWKTEFPSPRPAGSASGGLDQVYRRHLLGGTDELTRRLNLCFYGEANIDVSSPANLLAATIGLAVQGTTCTGGQPSVQFAVNPEFDWPPLLSLHAELDVFAEFKLNLWVREFGKRFTIPLLKINREFTTEPVFQLIPVGSFARLIEPANSAAATFHPSGSTRLSDFYPVGEFSVSGPGDLLAFSDVDPGTGQMLLKAARRDAGGAWLPPISIASAAGVVDVALAQTAGEWLVLWTELPAEEASSPFPTSTLKYSQSAEGLSWSPPAILASLAGVAAELRLHASGLYAALAFLETDGGPKATQFTLKTAVWNGRAWSSPAALLPDAPVRAFDLAGREDAATPEFELAWLLEDGLLRSVAGPAFDAAASRTIATDAVKTFDLAVPSSGPIEVVWRNTAKQVALARLAGGAWIPAGVVLPNVTPTELRFLRHGSGAAEQLLLAWTAGSPAAAYYAWLDAARQLRQPPALLTTDSPLAHGDMELVAGPDGPARLLARRRASAAGGQPLRAQTRSGDSLVELSIPTPMDLRIQGARLTAEGSFEFEIVGTRGGPSRLQISNDLRTWTTLRAVDSGSELVLVRDALTPTGARFYRVMTP